MVIQILVNNQLFANKKKCSFGQKEIEYLGHIISAKGVVADETKVVAMRDWLHPTSLKELREFLGLTGYYRRFVEGYGKITLPSTQQLKKDSFGWNDATEVAFLEIKKAVITMPVLDLPNFLQPFVIETDASEHGLGAVLMQNMRPIAYFSQVLPPRVQNKSIYERELMAIVLAVQK